MLTVRWTVFPRFEADLIVRYTGPRMDNAGYKLKQYTTVDMALNYDLTDNFTIFADFKNLFNEHYEEVRLYGEPRTPRRLRRTFLLRYTESSVDSNLSRLSAHGYTG